MLAGPGPHLWLLDGVPAVATTWSAGQLGSRSRGYVGGAGALLMTLGTHAPNLGRKVGF